MHAASHDTPLAVETAARVSRILAPTDFSPLSKAAVDATIAMLERSPGTSVTVAHVVDPHRVIKDEIVCDESHSHTLSTRLNHADKLMRELRTEYGERTGLETRIVAGNAARAICDMAKDEGYDLIVMSSHGHTGLARVLIGSVAEQVVQEAPCAILVAKPPKDEAGEFLQGPAPLKFRRFLVGYDHRAGARHALDMARELAGSRESHVTLVQALEPDPVGLDPVADAQMRATRLDEALKKLTGVRARHQPAGVGWDLRVEIGEPWDVIVRVAKETSSDLIVVGPHEHTRWGHCYVGSTAQRVVRLAHCPVMVVK